MTFLAPIAFWGLLALALPLALHLRRLRVGRTIQVGSVRHLESLPTAERRGPRLRDPWLLLLRSALFATLVLLLARPLLDRSTRPQRAVALIDSAAPSELRDSLGANATSLVERIDDPWRRLQELDDSLPAGVPVTIAASNSSDLFTGPRPTSTRPVTWMPIVSTRAHIRSSPRSTQHAERSTPTQSRALAAAVASVVEEFGPLADTAGWRDRLPSWWRDSLASNSFPVAVAHALAPERTLPAPVLLATAQLLPATIRGSERPRGATPLHWWLWTLAVALFLSERIIAARRSSAP